MFEVYGIVYNNTENCKKQKKDNKKYGNIIIGKWEQNMRLMYGNIIIELVGKQLNPKN